MFDDGLDPPGIAERVGGHWNASKIGVPADMLHESVEEDEHNGGIDARSMAKFFGALASPTRLRLMEFICAGERSLGECADHVHLSKRQVSGHLRLLTDTGYLEPSHRGGQVYYGVATAQAPHLIHLARSFTRDNATELGCCSRIDQEQ